LRGPGELLGARQSGLADFRFANLARDARLLAEARREALAWLDNDPELRSKDSAIDPIPWFRPVAKLTVVRMGVTSLMP